MKNEKFEIIAKTFQGLEDVLAEEITRLGGENVEIGRRMVSFSGNQELLYKANLYLRTALRILKPIYKFTAKNTDEVYEKIKQFDWEKYLSTGKTFSIDSVVYSEEFKHSKFVTYRTKDAIVDYFTEKNGDRPSVRINNADLILNLHISQHNCTLSLDSSGESLHKRGYRVEQTEAPINEVLAAGMILKTGWKGDKNFIDPMCGSGTLLIEAALIATNTPPGIYRKDFAFEKWNDYDEELFDKIYNDDSNEKNFEYKIYGSDISPKAISIAERNIKSAGMTKYIDLKVTPFQRYEEAPENAILVTNPPYGERISTQDLLGLYEMIGSQLKHVFRGYDAWIISYRDECFEKIGLKPAIKIELMNGALECQYRKYEIFEGKYKDFKRDTGGFRENRSEEFTPGTIRKRESRSDSRNTFSKPSEEKRKYTPKENKERQSAGQDTETGENRRPEILHGEEAIEKFVRFRLPSIEDPEVDNRPGWKKLRDKNLERVRKDREKEEKNNMFRQTPSGLTDKKAGRSDRKPYENRNNKPSGKRENNFSRNKDNKPFGKRDGKSPYRKNNDKNNKTDN